ncbi:cadherin-6 [Coregonus clupeaformis]|uniref:cadherin-6 n=1 Tax=Coregonus clupeaformis TaxID=59861 RepID=UPI001E1C9B57|nr:cadherin-6 [Coregonus clupeaformis]
MYFSTKPSTIPIHNALEPSPSTAPPGAIHHPRPHAIESHPRPTTPQSHPTIPIPTALGPSTIPSHSALEPSTITTSTRPGAIHHPRPQRPRAIPVHSALGPSTMPRPQRPRDIHHPHPSAPPEPSPSHNALGAIHHPRPHSVPEPSTIPVRNALGAIHHPQPSTIPDPQLAPQRPSTIPVPRRPRAILIHSRPQSHPPSPSTTRPRAIPIHTAPEPSTIPVKNALEPSTIPVHNAPKPFTIPVLATPKSPSVPTAPRNPPPRPRPPGPSTIPSHNRPQGQPPSPSTSAPEPSPSATPPKPSTIPVPQRQSHPPSTTPQEPSTIPVPQRPQSHPHPNAPEPSTIPDPQPPRAIPIHSGPEPSTIPPLDFERKRLYTLRIQVENSNPDPRFLRYAATTDEATVKLIVEDVDEPPVFDRVSYVMEVKEDSALGTILGSVSATDPDSSRSPVRYSIDRHTDMDRVFNVHPGNGSVFMLTTLDREANLWHNISVIATEFNNPRLMSRVPVYIRVLDINDNAPTFATYYETFVCENAKANQRIQTVSATDADEPISGHRFFFSLAHEVSGKANFTVRDNKDNTAWILTRRNSYSRLQRSTYLVPVVISDGDFPMQSSTNTLTVRVCTCDREGNMQLCNQEALVLTAGLSTGALMAIIICVLILLIIVVLFAALRRQQRKKEPLIISKEDVRDNVVSYNDEGGGEEDTQAFDIGTLRNPEAIEETKQRRDIKPETLHPPVRRTVVLPPAHRDNSDVREFINQRLQDNDQDPTAPPYDSLATYAYEGSGSVAESLSSLGSVTTEGDQDYNYLSEWGPRFRKLADMYGVEDSDGCRDS